MRHARLVRSVALGTLLLAATAARAETELKNDSFVSAGDAVFMGGFVTGEIGAARFIPAGPCTITRLQLLFGGAATAQSVTVHVYDDSAEVTTPGSELMTAITVQMTGSNSAFQQVDLTPLGPITATGPFRVGFEWQHDGYPCIAHDTDGNNYPDRNFIYTNGGWETSLWAGVAGDWIIRAFVVYSFDAGVQEDASVPLDAAPQQDSGTSSCWHDTDCPAGQYCGEWTRNSDDGGYGVCTHNCVSDLSCVGGTTCNSLGRCVARGSGCGCAAPGARPMGPLLALALVGLALVLVRRRR